MRLSLQLQNGFYEHCPGSCVFPFLVKLVRALPETWKVLPHLTWLSERLLIDAFARFARVGAFVPGLVIGRDHEKVRVPFRQTA